MSQSDSWLVIYGREKQNKYLLQKQHSCCSPAMSNQVTFKDVVLRRIEIFYHYFKGLVLSIDKRGLSIF